MKDKIVANYGLVYPKEKIKADAVDLLGFELAGLVKTH